MGAFQPTLLKGSLYQMLPRVQVALNFWGLCLDPSQRSCIETSNPTRKSIEDQIAHLHSPSAIVLQMIHIKIKQLTKMVRSNPTTATAYHLVLSFAFKKIFIQKARAGPAIRTVDKRSDATSGPNTSLPPSRNFYKMHKHHLNQL